MNCFLVIRKKTIWEKKKGITLTFTQFLGCTCLTNHFLSFSSNIQYVSSPIYTWKDMAYIRTAWNDQSIHVAACTVVFILLCHLGQHGKCSNLLKLISFKNFQALLSVSLRFCAGPDANHTVLYKNCESMHYSCVPMVFILLCNQALQGECSNVWGLLNSKSS